MDNILAKFGHYDIWTVIFPGGVFLFLIRNIYSFLSSLHDNTHNLVNLVDSNWIIPTSVYELFFFLVFAYLVGIILQEIGGVIKKILYYNGKPEELLLENDRGILNADEIHNFEKVFLMLSACEKISDNLADRRKKSSIIFKKMNAELQKEKIADKYVKLNILYNQSINLCAGLSGILTIVIYFQIRYLCQINMIRISLFISLILVFCLIILIHRGKKYYRYWIRNIVYSYMATQEVHK